MPTLKIDGVRTVNQNGQNVTLFDPYNDALALTLDIAASSDLLALPSPSWSAVFQLIDPMTDTVLSNQSWGSNFVWQYFWISMGNNWGPNSADYTTPKAWGLNWTQNSVFGFRGIITAHSWPGGGSGLVTVDAFDVSPIRWFRVKEIFEL